MSDEYNYRTDINYDDIQNNKLFQKFLKKEENQQNKLSAPPPQKQIKSQIKPPPVEQSKPLDYFEETPIKGESRVNFNPSFEPSYQEFIEQSHTRQEQIQNQSRNQREMKQWKPSPDKLKESSIYQDFTQFNKQILEDNYTQKATSRERFNPKQREDISPYYKEDQNKINKNNGNKIEQQCKNLAINKLDNQYLQQNYNIPSVQQNQSQIYTTNQPTITSQTFNIPQNLPVQQNPPIVAKQNFDESLYDDRMKQQNLQILNTQYQNQIDKLTQTINELRRKALDESHKLQDQILSQNDKIQNLQEKIYELQKSEDFLQLENDRLKNRMNQENLLRTKVEEDQKEISMKNIDLQDKLVQAEQLLQRAKDENIHLRTQNDQIKSDTMMFKQQLQSLSDRNNYMESQLRQEIQRKDMIQSQLLDAQERIHRTQIDQEAYRSEINEHRRIQQEQQLEIESLKKQLQERRNYSMERARQIQYLQSQLFQANQSNDNLKQNIFQMESQFNHQRQNNLMKTTPFQAVQSIEPYMNSLDESIIRENKHTPQRNTKEYRDQREAQKPINQQQLDTSYDQYQKYQQQQQKPKIQQQQIQAQQGGQKNIKEQSYPPTQSADQQIRDTEQQLLNFQLQKQQISTEIKKIEESKVRTGANIRKKMELEKQLVTVDQSLVQLRNKLRELNALIL